MRSRISTSVEIVRASEGASTAPAAALVDRAPAPLLPLIYHVVVALVVGALGDDLAHAVAVKVYLIDEVPVFVGVLVALVEPLPGRLQAALGRLHDEEERVVVGRRPLLLGEE